MALCPNNDPFWLSNQVPEWVIDNGNGESDLLANLEYSEL